MWKFLSVAVLFPLLTTSLLIGSRKIQKRSKLSSLAYIHEANIFYPLDTWFSAGAPRQDSWIYKDTSSNLLVSNGSSLNLITDSAQVASFIIISSTITFTSGSVLSLYEAQPSKVHFQLWTEESVLAVESSVVEFLPTTQVFLFGGKLRLNSAQIHSENDVTILLGRGYPWNPTLDPVVAVMEMSPGSILRAQDRATINIQGTFKQGNQSEVVLDKDSLLEIRYSSTIVIGSAGSLKLAPGSAFVAYQKSALTIGNNAVILCEYGRLILDTCTSCTLSQNYTLSGVGGAIILKSGHNSNGFLCVSVC